MTIDEARQAIYDRFKSEWGTRTIYTFAGEKFTEPGPDVDWVRLSVRHRGGGQETLGPKTGRKYRRFGGIFVQVFTPVGKGEKAGSSHAHAARVIFEGESFGGVDTDNGEIKEIGDNGKHYQTNLEVHFAYEEIK